MLLAMHFLHPGAHERQGIRQSIGQEVPTMPGDPGAGL